MKAKFDAIKRLIKCVRVLGLYLGYRYWRLDQYARKDPEIVLRWCEGMDHLAGLLREDGRPYEADLLQQWSDKCREAYNQYVDETR